jgi:hypothetical protein
MTRTNTLRKVIAEEKQNKKQFFIFIFWALVNSGNFRKKNCQNFEKKNGKIFPFFGGINLTKISLYFWKNHHLFNIENLINNIKIYLWIYINIILKS